MIRRVLLENCRSCEPLAERCAASERPRTQVFARQSSREANFAAECNLFDCHSSQAAEWAAALDDHLWQQPSGRTRPNFASTWDLDSAWRFAELRRACLWIAQCSGCRWALCACTWHDSPPRRSWTSRMRRLSICHRDSEQKARLVHRPPLRTCCRLVRRTQSSKTKM